MAPGCTLLNNHSQQIYNSSSPASSASDKEQRSMLRLTNSISYNHSGLVSCYDPFYLDQIPLPANPPTHTSPNTKAHKQLRISKSPMFRSNETVDSFEILEQTIMKQKRLARLKNTDMRKKILLKRTFNLVCEMMDQENGYEGKDANVCVLAGDNVEMVEMGEMSQEQREDCDLQETLIINLNESESLECAFQDEFDAQQLNYTDLENFNYGNLLENEGTMSSGESECGLDKNKSFLSDEFFCGRSSKRRRCSEDDEVEFEEEFEVVGERSLASGSKSGFFMFSDLTNSNGGGSGKGGRHGRSSQHSDSNGGKRFKSESIHIVR